MSSVVLKNAAFAYPSAPERLVLEGIYEEIPLGGHTLVLGGNGSGKTALARLLTGLDSPTAGSVVWPGKQATENHLLSAGVVFEQPEFQFQGFTVREELCGGLLYHGIESSRADELAEEAATRFGIDNLLDSNLDSLDYSSKLAVLIIAFLLLRPSMLVLDFSLAELESIFRKTLLSVCTGQNSPVLVVLSRRAEDLTLLEDACVFVLISGCLRKLTPSEKDSNSLELLHLAGVDMNSSELLNFPKE